MILNYAISLFGAATLRIWRYSLYVVNNSAPNRLYRNNGNSTFTDISASAGVADSGAGWGAEWGDFDGDGDLDLYMANNGTNRLYRNNGNSTFTDIGAAAGVADGGNANGEAWADFDGDGNLDLFLANNGSANHLFRNNGDSTFTEIGSLAGVAQTANSRGVAWGDFDSDGDLDLYVTKNGAANTLFVNNLNPYPQTYQSLEVLNNLGQWTQNGIRIVLKATSGGTHVATRTLHGGSYTSQGATPVIFYNLSPWTSYDVVITWSDGSMSTHTIGVPSTSPKSICKGVGLCTP